MTFDVTPPTRTRRPVLPFLQSDIAIGAGAILVALVVAMPIIALFVMAATGDGASFGRLVETILPRASLTTLGLLAGLAVLTGIIGALSAWLISYFSFPGRNILSWALMLPLAVPTYISAYAFVEFFTFTGPIQSFIRQIGGFTSARDYWFPDIRSLPGAILVLSLVLYPYVYLAVRALFQLQGRRAIEAAQVLGAGHRRILIRILIPLARPALALGIILAMMEAINDIGAMEFLGVRTLTFATFSVWVNQGDMAGSAQLALALLLFVICLIAAERWARKGQRYDDSKVRVTREPFTRQRLSGVGAVAAFVACVLPVALGFGVPFFTLGVYALRYVSRGLDPRLLSALSTSVMLAAIAALVTVLLALLLAYAVRVRNTARIQLAVRAAAVGYAMPGTIIALGIFMPLARLDNFIDGQMRMLFDVSTGLLITGSGVTLIYAYAVRFMAIAEGTIDGGFRKISPTLDMAAACYGRSRWQTLTQVLMPLLKPAIASAALLVFIDSLKELSATLMLRPFGIETVSIYIHDLASRGRIEQAGLAALLVMVIGIIPVIMLTRMSLQRDAD